MIIARRWVGLGCVLSAALVGACDSTSGNPAAAAAGAGGDGSAGIVSAAAGANEPGASGASGASQSSAGSTSHGGVGGMAAGGGNSVSAGAGGMTNGAGSGSAGAPQGGTGGTQGGVSCAGAQVLFLIQRSGALFEQPGIANTGEALPLADSYFGFLQAALSGEASVAKPYEGQFAIGVSFLFAARDLLVSAVPAICPQLTATAPTLQFHSSLAMAFAQGLADHAALVTAKQKEEAPVPEGVASAVAAWPGTSGARHLVLITTAMPDTCTQFDGPCGIDATVKAVQDAKAAGVTTHVIGLGDDPHFNYLSSDPDPGPVESGYEEYLQQLANAGSAKPLGPPNVEKVQDYVCGSATPAVLSASYSTTPGDAKFYQVKTATDAKTAVAQILAGICP